MRRVVRFTIDHSPLILPALVAIGIAVWLLAIGGPPSYEIEVPPYAGL